jgi:hypothetical protein
MSRTLVVIRDRWETCSLKARFIVQINRDSSNINTFYVVRNGRKMFAEKWSQNKVELATSTSGIFLNHLLIMLKSPKDLHDRILRRLHKINLENTLDTKGFISMLSEILDQYFATAARSDNILPFLRNMDSTKIFLIDEFMSIRTLDLKLLKQLGAVIYVSQDVVSERYNFGDSIIASNLMYKLEREILQSADLIIACSGRDQLRYIEMGAKKVIFYPNIYPIMEFETGVKDKIPSISIVLRNCWGTESVISFNAIFKALSKINKKIMVHVVGIKPEQVPRNIELEYYDYIPKKLDYMNILSKSWIGINIGIHKGGSNERKYDYAMAGLVVFSDVLGCRGDLLAHEYSYLDHNDLAVKLEQLLEFGQEKIIEMGLENRKQAISLAKKQREKLLSTINTMFSQRLDRTPCLP